MSQIKYGEISVIHNVDSILTNLYFFFGYDEQYVSKESSIIIKFDEGESHNINNRVYDCRFRYNYKSTYLPSSFKTNGNLVYFKKCKNNDDTLDSQFTELFEQSEKYDITTNLSSYFNGIYFRHQSINGKITKVKKFGIVRLKSGIYSPIYKFAYDSSEFSKDHIIFIINNIFRRNNTILL